MPFPLSTAFPQTVFLLPHAARCGPDLLAANAFTRVQGTRHTDLPIWRQNQTSSTLVPVPDLRDGFVGASPHSRVILFGSA